MKHFSWTDRRKVQNFAQILELQLIHTFFRSWFVVLSLGGCFREQDLRHGGEGGTSPRGHIWALCKTTSVYNRPVPRNSDYCTITRQVSEKKITFQRCRYHMCCMLERLDTTSVMARFGDSSKSESSCTDTTIWSVLCSVCSITENKYIVPLSTFPYSKQSLSCTSLRTCPDAGMWLHPAIDQCENIVKQHLFFAYSFSRYKRLGKK